jgi:tetratricopeptide (TPR) repeat protein
LILDAVPDAPCAAHVVDDVVRLIDIAPTIADYADVSFPSSGLSLRPFVEGQAQPPRIAYAETLFPYYHLGWSVMTMAQDTQRRVEKGLDARASLWKSAKKSLPTAELLAEMDARFGSTIPTPGAVSTAQQEALQSLGYMSGNEAPKQDVDPRDHIHVLSSLFQAQDLPYEESIPVLQTLINQHPSMIHAYTSLTLQYVQAGEIEKALAETEKALRILPSETQNLNNAAMLARQLKQYDKALAFVQAMRVAAPTDVRSYRIETAIYVDQENPKLVIKTANAGLELAPHDPNLHYLISLAYIFEEQPQQSLVHLEQAQRHHSQAKDISLWKGIAYEKIGDVDRAVQFYELATQELPKDLRAWARGGVLLADHNRCAQARRFLSNAVLRGAPPDARMKEALKQCPASATP